MRRLIALVGPVSPYRGGISQYNTALLRAITPSNGIFYSFARQYPAWLYPGKTDADPQRLTCREPHVDYSVDSINPLTWFRTAGKIVEQAPKVVFFHWWTIFFVPCFAAMTWALKRRGIRIGLICHNLVDHDASALKSIASNFMLALADGYVVHSTQHEKLLSSSQPGKPIVRYSMPAFSNFPRACGELKKRGRLELLFFGFIRPYKGLDLLISALSNLDDHDVHLTIAGETWGPASEIVDLAATAPNIELHLDYVSEQRAAEFFARADAVVLPYRAATGSAVASVANFYNTPIIATAVGGLTDVVQHGVTGILVPPDDVAALADAIRSFSRELAGEMSSSLESSDHRDWDAAAKKLYELTEMM